MNEKFLYFLSILLIVGAAPPGEEMVLLNRLLKNYNKHGRPVHNASTAVAVSVDMALVKIVDVDLKNEMLVTNIQLMQEWSDEFLRWDPKTNHNIMRIEVSTDLIWVPDIVLVNDVADYKQLRTMPNAVVLYNGEVLWNPRMQVKSSCQMDATFFPFDIQQCYMSFFSWTYSGDKLHVKFGKLKSIYFMETHVATAFVVTDSAIMKFMHREYWPTGDYNFTTIYTELVYAVELKRKILYHSYTILWPSIIISILTILIFRLSPDSGEKIELGVTTLLVFHVMLWTVGEKLPESSESVPLLAVYLTTVMTLTSLSVVMSIVVLNVHSMGAAHDIVKVPKWMRYIFLKKLSPLFGMEEKKISKTLTNMLKLSAGIPESNAVDRNEDEITQIEQLNRGILHALHTINEQQIEEKHKATLAHEWRFIARVIDRLLFWIYLLATAFLNVFFLLIYPAVQSRKPLKKYFIDKFSLD